jgi:hypothetical protein
MQTPSSVNRRQFLSGLFTVGVAGFLVRQNKIANEPQKPDHALRLNALIRVLQEHHMLHDDVLHDEQKANLVYAVEKIKPLNHAEEAVAVACSMSQQPVCHIVDEYVRRRNGGASLLPDHPVMTLKSWGVPDTYRMLLFQEQIYALLAELTGMVLLHARGFSGRMYRHQIKAQDLGLMLNERHPSLRANEVQLIYDAVCCYTPSARPYTWCSSMVSRAEQYL